MSDGLEISGASLACDDCGMAGSEIALDGVSGLVLTTVASMSYVSVRRLDPRFTVPPHCIVLCHAGRYVDKGIRTNPWCDTIVHLHARTFAATAGRLLVDVDWPSPALRRQQLCSTVVVVVEEEE